MAPLFEDDHHLSYAPFPMTPFTNQMSLTQRTINFVAAKLFFCLSHQWPQSKVRVIHMENMPEHLIQAFISTFASLPQCVGWQWKGEVREDLPNNVIAVPWLPQQDLLGHKNCKSFITHGGLNSLQEAIYHGVPVLGLPFGTDQVCNLNKASRDGYALKLDWKDITQESLSDALRQLFTNSTYKKVASKVSQLFRDQLQSPLDRTMYWTEYVLRHGGVEHLRLGSSELSTLQRLLVDVNLNVNSVLKQRKFNALRSTLLSS